MKKTILFAFLFFSLISTTYSQTDSTKTEEEQVKTGFNFGALPVVAYNSDIGFQYGVLANLYFFGDGSRYPLYDHSIYLEWSRSTKGNGNNVFRYDSDKLIPGIRTTAEASYRTEKALNFYGFNGYQSYYNANYEDDTSPDYISRMFYRHERKVVVLKADFQGSIIGRKLRWLAGITYLGSKIASVDIAKLNEGKDEADKLPDTAGLYDLYVDWGVIKDEQKSGGNNAFFKTGFVFDTRDNEPNPNSGMWSEALFLIGPKFMGEYSSTATALILIHRQYFTLVPKTLTFAYRLSYQTKTSGDIPFYILPYLYDSYNIRDGLGGSKTLRGILRNRVVGDGMAFANFEFRWKVLKTQFLKQNFYIALSGFADMGRVVDPYVFNRSNIPAQYQSWVNYNPESLHMSFGAGLHFAMNDNFIVAIDYGMATNEQDGTSGLYIGLNFLY